MMKYISAVLLIINPICGLCIVGCFITYGFLVGILSVGISSIIVYLNLMHYFYWTGEHFNDDTKPIGSNKWKTITDKSLILPPPAALPNGVEYIEPSELQYIDSDLFESRFKNKKTGKIIKI